MNNKECKCHLSHKHKNTYNCYVLMLSYKVFKHFENQEWVTFIHGAGGSSSIWHKQIKALSKQYNLLLIDLRGHGNSTKMKLPVSTYNFELLGNDILEVLDHLSIKTSHFIGISLGTILIRDLAERFPHRVQSMILGGAVMKINLRGQLLIHLGKTFRKVIPYLMLYRLFAWVIMPRKSHRTSRNIFINEAKKLYQKEFIRWFALTSKLNPVLRLFRLRPSSIPTLFIMGKEDHMFLPSIKKLVQLQKNVQLIVIPNAGHVVNIDQPLLFNNSVLHFLNQTKFNPIFVRNELTS